ncbi:MAG: DNA recombination protein RmuC [Nitratireductor sp.]|nr:DNA recombination protein RmuC [Nitratireductor sp.]
MQQSAFSLDLLLAEPLFRIGNRDMTLGMVLIGTALLVIAFLLLRIVAAYRSGQQLAAEKAAAGERAREAEMRMAELVASQNELTGRMQTLSEIFSTRQGDMMRLVDERLANMSGKLGESITQTTKSTHESLAKLQERLAVIDSAQNNITALTGQVVELQNILANKQTRGAFGEARMAAIVEDGLPRGAYAFQATLSNGARPDCLVFMPNESPALVIDAKFPLESWNAIRRGDNADEKRLAGQQFRRDVETHIKAIAEKYLIQGETQDTAFMFVPSESIFAEIHENFEGVVQRAHRSRVVIVSPSLLMLSIQVIQSVLKDTRMREQAHLIQGEVIRLMEDVSRLDERVRKLSAHFTMAQKDVEQIVTSADKVTRRGTKIAELDFEDVRQAEAAARARLRAVE